MRANANAASEANRTVSVTAIAAITTLLSSSPQKVGANLPTSTSW